MDRGLFTIPLAQKKVSAGARAAEPLSFDEFIGGAENGLLDALFRRPLSELAGSPLFLHGQSGVGKTALVFALADRFRSTYQSKDACILGAVDLARELLPARAESLEDSPQNNLPRLVAVEDVHHLKQHGSGQRMLRELIDDSTASGDLLIMTSALPPGELRYFDSAIRSRLGGGYVVPVLPPLRETRQAMVEQLASRCKINLDPQTKKALVESESLTGRALIATLTQYKMAAQSDGEHAASSASPPLDLPLSLITRYVARDAGLRMQDLRGPSRRRMTVRSRAAAMYLARRLTSLSLKQIGQYFNNRDHTTVLHACRSIDQQRRGDDAWSQNLHDIETLLIRNAVSSGSVEH